MKSIADNLRLFQEAQQLRKDVRSDLHKRATNSPRTPENVNQATPDSRRNMDTESSNS